MFLADLINLNSCIYMVSSHERIRIDWWKFSSVKNNLRMSNKPLKLTTESNSGKRLSVLWCGIYIFHGRMKTTVLLCCLFQERLLSLCFKCLLNIHMSFVGQVSFWIQLIGTLVVALHNAFCILPFFATHMLYLVSNFQLSLESDWLRLV